MRGFNENLIIDQDTYYYKVMPFDLKNEGVTYQHLVNKIFKLQIGRSTEIYIDDMLVKSLKLAKLVPNLGETSPF